MLRLLAKPYVGFPLAGIFHVHSNEPPPPPPPPTGLGRLLLNVLSRPSSTSVNNTVRLRDITCCLALQGVEATQDLTGSALGTPQPALHSLAVIPSISLRQMLILQQTGFTAATTNAITTATHVNSTLGNTIQQLQQSVEEVEGVLPEVEAAVDGDSTYDNKKNLLDLEHTVLALEVGAYVISPSYTPS